MNTIKKMRVLATACSLILLASATAAAEVTEQRLTADTSSAEEVAYPSLDVMKVLYHNLARDKKIEPGKGLFSPNLADEELLQDIYKYALEIGYIDKNTFSNLAPSRLVASKAASLACKTSAVTCGLGAGVAGVFVLSALASCAAAAVEVGANPLADAACATALPRAYAAGGTTFTACTTMALTCNHKDPVVSDLTITRVGSTAAGHKELYCPSSYHVMRMKSYMSNGLNGKIILTCSDGSEISFGRNDTGGFISVQCTTSYLAGGLQIRKTSNNLISGVGLACDEIVKSGNNIYTDIEGATQGSPGTIYKSECREGQHMHGLKVFYEKNGLARNSSIYGIEVKCKNG